VSSSISSDNGGEIFFLVGHNFQGPRPRHGSTKYSIFVIQLNKQ
jgi:hypothetical protein